MTRLLDMAPEELVKLVRPGPRYTSYPPATEFGAGFGAKEASAALGRLALMGKPFSLYAHVPFCRSLCWYCGCNVTITREAARGDAYIDTAIAELDLLKAVAEFQNPVTEIALGGGSPNFLSPQGLERLTRAFYDRFAVTDDAVLGIELDPRETSIEQLRLATTFGYNRISVGIQDFHPEVQALIHRIQSVEQTRALIEAAREYGIKTVNADLIYGLPAQTPERFAETLREVVTMRPDRIALFGYAHLPTLRPHQKLVERGGPLPDTTARAGLLALALETFERAGYQRVGIDHFALPDDALAVAAREHNVHRNFQGYVPPNARHVVAVGPTGISDAAGAYWQNIADVAAWQAAVERGELPVARGITLSTDDMIRRHVINRLMCDGSLSFAEVDSTFGIHFEDYFAKELTTLGDHAELIDYDAGGRTIEANELGVLLIRNVCMEFDAHLARLGPDGKPRHRFSPTL